MKKDGRDLELVLGCLTDAEETLIRIRYGISDGIKREIKEVADILRISQDQAEEIEKSALLKLHSPKKWKVFEKYLHQQLSKQNDFK